MAGGKGETKGKTGGPEIITLAETLMAEGENQDLFSVEEMPMILPSDATDLGREPCSNQGMDYVFLGETCSGRPKLFESYSSMDAMGNQWGGRQTV